MHIHHDMAGHAHTHDSRVWLQIQTMDVNSFIYHETQYIHIAELSSQNKGLFFVAVVVQPRSSAYQSCGCFTVAFLQAGYQLGVEL